MNVNEYNKIECCGCSACSKVCPKNAISMVEDEKGFKYPFVNKNKCINCGLCVKVCDFKKFEKTKIVPRAYAVKHKSDDEVKTSRSGAFFMALCDYILDKNGIVFGCSMENKTTIIHKFETTKEGVNHFKGSKYVQSDIKNTFNECRDFLIQGRYVLYSGTGCQVHGLLSFLEFQNIDTRKLITCDVVCHGTPSPKIWREYVSEYEKRAGSDIIKVDFRNKIDFGWKAHIESFLMSSGKKDNIKNWTNVFYSHVMFRESCYNCKYTTTNRLTNFTIADYWGIENNVPDFDDDKGASLVLVHDKRAQDIFKSISNKLNYKETNISTSLQPQLIHPVKKGRNYDKFWNDYFKNNNKAIKKYFFPNKLSVIFNKALNKIYK